MAGTTGSGRGGGSGPGRRNTERVQIVLSCTECGSRNYKTTRARREGIEALSLKKFCRTCNRHTVHIESK